MNFSLKVSPCPVADPGGILEASSGSWAVSYESFRATLYTTEKFSTIVAHG